MSLLPEWLGSSRSCCRWNRAVMSVSPCFVNRCGVPVWLVIGRQPFISGDERLSPSPYRFVTAQFVAGWNMRCGGSRSLRLPGQWQAIKELSLSGDRTARAHIDAGKPWTEPSGYNSACTLRVRKSITSLRKRARQAAPLPEIGNLFFHRPLEGTCITLECRRDMLRPPRPEPRAT